MCSSVLSSRMTRIRPAAQPLFWKGPFLSTTLGSSASLCWWNWSGCWSEPIDFRRTRSPARSNRFCARTIADRPQGGSCRGVRHLPDETRIVRRRADRDPCRARRLRACRHVRQEDGAAAGVSVAVNSAAPLIVALLRPCMCGSSPRVTNLKARAHGAPHKGQGRSPARSCWGKSVKAVIGPLPLGRSNTKTRS